MGFFDFLVRDINKLSLEGFISRYSKKHGEWEAKELEDKIIDALLIDSPNASLSELKKMKWGEVKFRANRINKRMEEQLTLIKELIAQGSRNTKVGSFLKDPSWTYAIGSLPEEDELFERNL
jgi:hypothetical protein